MAPVAPVMTIDFPCKRIKLTFFYPPMSNVYSSYVSVSCQERSLQVCESHPGLTPTVSKENQDQSEETCWSGPVSSSLLFRVASNVSGKYLLLSDKCDSPQGRGYPVTILAMLGRAPTVLFYLNRITDMLE